MNTTFCQSAQIIITSVITHFCIFRPSSSGEVSCDFLAEQMFSCLKCGQETKLGRSFVDNHLRRHRLSLQEYLDTFDTPDNQSRLATVRQWVQQEEYLNKISGEFLS